MKITLHNVGKKFRSDWVFRNVSLDFEDNSSWVILGPNGSGKSTLLQIISGFITPSEGEVLFHENDKPVAVDHLHGKISISSPYMDLVGKFTLEETLYFHEQLAGFQDGLTGSEVLEILNMEEHRAKFFESFSSGMKMRIRNVLAILSDTSLLLLDEPLSNMDKKGEEWYLDLIDKYTLNRTVIVCSNNVMSEYSFCKNTYTIPSKQE